jgi:hypothetical protein
MAVLGTAFNLVDWAKRRDPDGKAAAVAELLAQTNSILDDMLWKEGNLPTGHRLTVRTGLPTSYWRLLNQGVQPSKSTTAQIDESCGMLEAYSVLDKDLVELNGDVASTRLTEASAHIEGMNQEMASTLFYGNVGLNPEEFNGLAVRYSSLSAANGQNIINASGAGSDNSSIWLVCWGENTVHGIFPKGSKAGLVRNDLGLDVVDNAGGVAGAKMMAYQEHFQWKCGLALKDWRYAVRIANIDISNLAAGSGADLINLMIKAIHRIPSLKLGKPVFYMNRSCFQYLDIQRRDDVISGGGLVYNQVDGVLVPSFRGIPIKLVDALTETESVVS